MEAVLSVAFGVWIVITAFVYWTVTGPKHGDGQKK